MKKGSVLIIVCIIASLLTACGSGVADDTIKIRVACHHPQEHPAVEALERIKAKVEAETDGKVEMTLYPGNQLGDYTLIYEEVMKGSVELAHIYIPSQFDSMLEIAAIPYLVEDYDQMEKIFRPGSYFYDKYTEIHKNQGVKLLGIYADGFIGYGVKDLPDNYDDVTKSKNNLIRIPGMDVYKLTTEDMGYPSTSIAYADLYSALQTGVADGWVGGTSMMNYLWFRDAIDNFIQYNVFMENSSYIVNEEFFNSLPEEYKGIIEGAFREESLNSFVTCEELDKEGVKGLTEYGVNVVGLNGEKMKAYADYIRKTTWPKLAEKFGEEVMEGLLNDVN